MKDKPNICKSYFYNIIICKVLLFVCATLFSKTWSANVFVIMVSLLETDEKNSNKILR